jgi:hypothetical protein
MPQIIVTVTPKGETSLETKGFFGAGCRKATQRIERALGKVVSDKPTAEHHQVAPCRQRVQNP